jgi:hypothetical protein
LLKIHRATHSSGRSPGALEVLGSRLADGLLAVSLEGVVAAERLDNLLTVLLGLLAGVCDVVSVSDLLAFEARPPVGVGYSLGLERLALCPRICEVICSLPSVSSFMSLDITDLAPWEFMVGLGDVVSV